MSKKMNTVEGPFGSYDHGAPGAEYVPATILIHRVK